MTSFSKMTPECLVQIKGALRPFPGWRHWHLDRVVSTQDSLREALRQGEREHLALSAGVQTHGRGRHGRTWDQEPEKDLALSILLKPKGRYPPLLLPFLLPTALFTALRTLGVPQGLLRIKWPNDLFLREKKIAGVLIEGEGSGAFLCGVGCNVERTKFPTELEGIASSLRLEGIDRIQYPELLLVFLMKIAGMVQEAEKGQWTKILRTYQEGFAWIGEEVVLATKGGGIQGRLIRLGPKGLQLSNGLRLDVGEVFGIRKVKGS